MSQSILRRRLVDVSERLKKLRAELAVTDEQLVFLEDEAEDAARCAPSSPRRRSPTSRRGMPAGTPMSWRRHRDVLRRSIASLVREQDSLLDRMAAELSAALTGAPALVTRHPLLRAACRKPES